MNAEQHALAILNAIQAAEAAGYEVCISDRSDRGVIEVATHFSLVEPFFDDQAWEATVDR